jgi:hypothetical protein
MPVANYRYNVEWHEEAGRSEIWSAPYHAEQAAIARAGIALYDAGEQLIAALQRGDVSEGQVREFLTLSRRYSDLKDTAEAGYRTGNYRGYVADGRE